VIDNPEPEFVYRLPAARVFNLTRQFRDNKINGEEVRNKIDAYLNASTSHW
jgi:hypothetical protein